MRTLLGLALILCLHATAPGAAEPLTAAPSVIKPKRLVHFFDFEERKFGNYEDLPMHWYVTGRPAQTSDLNFTRQPLHRQLIDKQSFPSWADVRFDRDEALSGETSFYLGMNGGNAGAFLEVGTLPAVPTSDYLVSAWVRTRGMRRASARVAAYFIDAHGLEILGSRVITDPIRHAEEWTEVTVKLRGDFPDAAYIGLELEALQPAPSLDNPLGEQQVVLRDVGGGAWFDDISVWQLPHVEVQTQSAVNTIRGPMRPQLAVDVRDLTGQRLMASVTIYDHTYQPVAKEERQIGAGMPMNWRWTPQLPRYGWYLVDLLVREMPREGSAATPTGPVARTVSALLWLPPEPPLPTDDRFRFALVAEEASSEVLALLPQVLDATKLDAAVISAWSRETTLDTLQKRQDEIDDALRAILTTGRSVTMSLHPVPKELAELESIDSSQPLDVLRGDPQAWLPYLAPVLMQQGQRIRHWQLGQTPNAEAFFYGDLAGLLSGIEQRFRQLAPQPRLILPWRLDQSRRPELGDELIIGMDVPTAVTPEHIDAHLEEWQNPPQTLWLYLHEPPADAVAHEGRVRDLALRMIHGWRSGVAALALPRPWAPSVERKDTIWPDPLLGVFANTAQRLAGRRMIGALDLGQDIDCHILDAPGNPRGGMLILVSRGAKPGEDAVELYLGENPVAIDLWGNRTPLATRNGRQRVVVGPDPIFIEGIDTELAMFRSSFRITPGFVEALQGPHHHEVELRNPWGRTISGSLQFTGPPGWRVAPLKHHFSLAAGQSMRLPIELSFPFAELAGPKHLAARFDFTANQHYNVELTAPIELGLPGVQLYPTVALEPTGTPGVYNAEVVCVVTNTGQTTLTMSAFANLRNHPRIERAIAALHPGQSVVRRFQFKNITPEDRAAPLRVGLRETNGPAVLNKQLDLSR